MVGWSVFATQAFGRPAHALDASWPVQAGPAFASRGTQVEQLSKEAQEVIARYTRDGTELLARYAALSSVLGVQPWATPAIEDYRLLAKVRRRPAIAKRWPDSHSGTLRRALLDLEGPACHMGRV